MLLVAWLKLLLLNYKRTTTQTHWHRPVFVNSVVEKEDLNTRRRVLNNSERLSKHGTSSTNVELRRTKVSLHKQQSNISTNLRTCFFLVPSVFSISLHACHTPASCSILFFLWVNSWKRHSAPFEIHYCHPLDWVGTDLRTCIFLTRLSQNSSWSVSLI